MNKVPNMNTRWKGDHVNKFQSKTLSKGPEEIFRSTMCSAETTQPKTLKLIPLIGTWKWARFLNQWSGLKEIITQNSKQAL